jgi:enoyl-CoA hydratase/3-hydroxyacyl-CoA dehydrogenase
VDIVPGPRTDGAVIELLERYVNSLSGVPVVLKKEYPGYLLNAMLGPVIGTALALVATGVASIEDVDRAWMSQRRAPMGPLGMLDYFGLNIALDSWEHGQQDATQEALRPRVLGLLRPYAERGELGVKTGRGFYSYPQPAYQGPGFADGASGLEPIAAALSVALVTHALCIAAKDVAEPAMIDRAWMVGTSLDTGPFEILEQMGVPEFLQALATEEAAGRLLPARARIAEAYLQQNQGAHQ